MSDIDEKVLKMLEDLQADVKGLKAGQQALDLKVEAIHAYQKQAHTELLEHIIEGIDMNTENQEALEKEIALIRVYFDL